jgi:hypothetical protein
MPHRRPNALVRRLSAVVFMVALLGAARDAAAKQVHFVGAHPIASKFGGGFCYIEVPHIHAYPPDHAALYQQVGDQFVFTGDPTPFGYEGERHPFYGHHPVVTVNGEPVYCYIEGPHVHPFIAPQTPDYKITNGVAFYVGPFDPAYARLRPHRVKVVNAEYRPFVSFRPTVEVTPPPEWHGEVWVAPPAIAVQAPGVTVAAPGVVVAAPVPPTVVVAPPGPPGVIVAGPRMHVRPHGVVVGPPGVMVGAPGVVVGAPGVVVGAPGVVVSSPGVAVAAPGVMVVPGRGHGRHGDDDDQGHGHHDNGKHKGWR